MDVGDELPTLAVTPDRYLPHRYAGASGDFNPIHIDPDFARSVGLPGNILHGLYGMALVARSAAVAAGGDPRRLRSLSVQFRGMAMPEAEVEVTGKVTAVEGDSVTLGLTSRQGGKRVIRNGAAVIDVPRP